MQFEVDRNDLHSTRFVDDPIRAGTVLRIDAFALTSNNVTSACLPTGCAPDAAGDTLVLTVERSVSPMPIPGGVTTLATFDVEGVVVGDERAFDRVRFDVANGDASLAALVDAAARAHEAYVVHVTRMIDNLITSIVEEH